MKPHALTSSLFAFFVLIAFIEPSAAAQDYPSKPVRIIMSPPAGNGPDVVGRIVADHLSKIWGQQAVVINQPGAGGALAVRAAGTALPDGHNLYFAVSSNFIALPELQAKLPFDVARDFVPIGFVGEQPFVVGVSPRLGVDSLSDLIALSKRKPGEINLAVGGRGGLPHLTGEWLRRASGSDMTVIHYPGLPQALTDLMAGRVHVYIESLSALAGAIAGAQIKPLAVTSKQRLPNRPDLPTVAETIPEFAAMGWFALMAPPATPQTYALKVSNDLRTALARPGLLQRFLELGTYTRPMSPAELKDFIQTQKQIWRPVINELSLQTPK